MQVELSDGYRIFVHQVGEGFALVVLHGGPGMDHTMFRPYLDPLADEHRLLYVDQRGQGRSDRVDPATLSLDVFSRDVDRLVEALGLDRFALLGHSFGAIVTTKHAIEIGTADAYVISGGGDSSEKLLADVDASLEELGDEGAAIAQSWEDEKTVTTEAGLKELVRTQMPFHSRATRLRATATKPSAPLTFCATSPGRATASSTTCPSSDVYASRR